MITIPEFKCVCSIFRKTFVHLKLLENNYSTISRQNCLIKRKTNFLFFQPWSNISTSSLTLKAHTTKGWKSIAVNGRKAKTDSDVIHAACEEGSSAILHSDLVADLQNCYSVSDQIEKFCSLVSLSDEDLENRALFCKSLEDIFKIYFTNFKIHQFGSSVNGLGFKGCDMDVSLQTLFQNEDYIMLKDVPTLEAALDGSVPQETLRCMNPMFMLRFVRRILRRHSTDIKEPILFIKARCPILRFYNAKYDVFCDFSCETDSSLRNTRLLRLICQLDERFTVLAKLIRYWGKYGGFVGDIEMFNSYSFSLFVVYFLQNVDPPILPPMKEIIDKSNYLKSACVDDVSTMFEDLKHFSPSENSISVEKLLRYFYFFYLNFDFERVLQPYSSSSIHKSEFSCEDNSEANFVFGTVSIQDIFQHNFNATGTVAFKNCLKFMSGLVQACDTYQESFNWSPKQEMWGLCSLFKPAMNDFRRTREWQEKRNHQIKFRTKSATAAVKVKKILEHGLLFHCKEFTISKSSEHSSNIILKLQCRVYKNTWQGHYIMSRKFQDSKDGPLEIENMVSQEIIQSKTEQNREVLAEFTCDCREIMVENEKDLVLDLNFIGKKFPYTLAIFLKEYIPNIFNKL